MSHRIGAGLAVLASVLSFGVAVAQTDPNSDPLAPGADSLAPGKDRLAPGWDSLAPGHAPPGSDPLANGGNRGVNDPLMRASVLEQSLLTTNIRQAPPKADPLVQEETVLAPYNDIDRLKFRRGAGWCVYANENKKVAYYTRVFDGQPTVSFDQLGKTFESYVARLYPDASGKFRCSFGPFDADYAQADVEKQDQYLHVLQNYTIIQTDWLP